MDKKVFLIAFLGVLLLGSTGCGTDFKTNDNEAAKKEDNKINLNDNVEVIINTKSTGTPDCFFYMFTTNLEQIFPNAKIDTYNNYRSVPYWIGPSIDAADFEITEEGITNNIDLLQFNSNQEKAIVNLFKKYQDKTYNGLKNVEYNFENHRLTFSYNYLVFKNNNYKSEGEMLDSKVQQILVDAIKFKGTCGGFDFEEDSTLTEQICDEYNLNCGRW